jgi:hypothetical protein
MNVSYSAAVNLPGCRAGWDSGSDLRRAATALWIAGKLTEPPIRARAFRVVEIDLRFPLPIE